MATYKLIQDIEAEDHILGPLTLRQFIFAMIAALMFYICYFVTVKGTAFLLVLFLPPALFFGFFAMPFGRDQSTEVWALAKLRYFLKPRVRVWDQSGIKELVTITVPKRVEPVLTDGLNPYEVQSRLQALAETIDSRGWAVKNVTVNNMVQPIMGGYGSDRLIDVGALPQAVPDNDPTARDVLDTMSGPVAQQFDSMITQSEQQHRQQLIDEMNAPAPAASGGYWFMNQPAPVATPKAAAQTKQADPGILSLAQNNDLNIATLAREASKGDEEIGKKRPAPSVTVTSPALTVEHYMPPQPPQPVTSIARAPAPTPAPVDPPAIQAAPIGVATKTKAAQDSKPAINDSDTSTSNQTHSTDEDEDATESQEVVVNLH